MTFKSIAKHAAMIAAFSAGISGAKAAEAPMTLLDIFDAASFSNPRIAAAKAGKDVGDATENSAWMGMLLPQANMVFDHQRERDNVIRNDNPVYHVDKGVWGNYSKTIEVVQPVFDPRLFAQLWAAQAVSQRADYELTAAEQRLTYDVIEAYLLALSAGDAKTVAQNELSTLEGHLSEITERAKRGLANSLDDEEVQARVESIRAQVRQAAAAEIEARATLRKLCGVEVGKLYPLRENIPMPHPEPAAPEDWEEAAAAQNPTLRSLDATAKEAKADYQRQFSELLPHVDLHMSDSRLDSGNSLYGGGSLTDQKLLTLRLTVPLFNPQGLGYPEAQGMAKWRQSEFNRDAEVLDVKEKVDAAFVEAESNAERSKYLASALAHQEKVADGRRLKLKSGMGTEVEYLDAERDTYRARRELIGARYNYLLNMMQLRRFVGVISRQDVAYVNELLRLPAAIKQ